jgi:heme/copper-type cytochrome/quinol oxidase subunit 3
MEIPYLVTPRKDTGLFNSKIAIWLFLASEVMLFGGFFSAYVFLRLGADYPWPERALPVIPGLINTFVLIGSSVTVVFAWASLKMREWRKFQLFMGITVACAVVFMILKGIEYNVKFHHQALRLKDYSIIEGHLGKEEEAGKPILDHHGKEIEENLINVETAKLTFNTRRFYKPWVEELLAQASHRNAKITLATDISVKTKEGAEDNKQVIAKAGEPLSVELLNRLEEVRLHAASNNSAYRTAALREEWVKTHAAHPGVRDWKIASEVNVDMVALAPKLLTEVSSASFKVDPATKLDFYPRDIKEADGSSVLRDDTVVEGKLLDSPMIFHYVDAIDFQHLAMKAKEKGIDPEVAIQNSWLVKNNPFAKEAWEWNKTQIAKIQDELNKKYGFDKVTGKPKYEPTFKERYRIGWKDFVAKSDGSDRDKSKIQFNEEFFGPNYEGREKSETFSHLSVPRKQVGFAAKFTPAWNTYYAIYFTMTGLHGLHVIGGALVLAYYLFFGRKMYLSNPEWLANRVEVGGLFWHFVDLVWIFVFPILYLM